MSWIGKLYKTYENNISNIAKPSDEVPLLPLYHTTQKAQIHVVIDDGGNFISKASKVVSPDDSKTIIPATEGSAGRAGAKIAPHPLCDTLQYVAKDYLEWGGNPNKKKDVSGFQKYIDILQGWADWSANSKLRALLIYLQKGTLIKDLVESKILWQDSKGHLLGKWEGKDAPDIFRAIRKVQKRGQFEAFVRFSVFIPDDPQSELWGDPAIRNSWIEYYPTIHEGTGFCMVEGKELPLSLNHPKNIRYPGDGAKLISSNDEEGFTFLGRFTDPIEACGVGIEVTQKAHSALRWLIRRQGKVSDEQAIVAWAISNTEIPKEFYRDSLFSDTLSLLLGVGGDSPGNQEGYTAQEIGNQLSKLIDGYSVKLGSTDEVVVMGLDSATPGRMAISFYRELTGSELLERVQAWHEGCCWLQRFGKDKVFVGAPSPRDIAESAYGGTLKSNPTLRKATVERLLPCIVDGAPVPRDLVTACVRRASNRHGNRWGNRESQREYWEWEKALGIACALYRHQNSERRYLMALERDRKTRDYLYGRLLALAEHLESRALYIAGEKRETNAGRMMQRFAERPYSTWLNIETSMTPYKVRLRAKRHGFLHNIEEEIDEVMNSFDTNEFLSDGRLTGEFLLGYHCQQAALWAKPDLDVTDTVDTED